MEATTERRMQSLEEVQVSSVASAPILHIPHVQRDLRPKIKQHFDNLDAAHEFYNKYARAAGFGTRKNSSKVKGKTEVVRKEYVCFKEGSRKIAQQSSVPITRKRGIVREGCGAKLTVVKDYKSGKGFIVSQFVEAHNHPLATPRKVHFLRSHRKISAAKRALAEQLALANVPPSQQMSILEMEAGGLQNVGFLQRDLYNVARDKRKELDGLDVELLHENFLLKQEKNPGFQFKFLLDGEGRMKHCLWADATMRDSYRYFGDVVVFDSTYNTNRYKLIFAPIVGVNHHGQTTLFGCALLNDEKSESFEWLFEEWLKLMPAGPPKMIITDQCPAMIKAFAIVLPNTQHRYCIWHITSKFSEKLGVVQYAEHYDQLRDCIWNSESPTEFEASWREVVAKANLSSNEWLNEMYEIRDRWVPAYVRHIFSAHMTSSSRAEGCHAFFKRFVCVENSLVDFVVRFDRALSHMRHNELDLDHKDVNEKPIIKTMWKVELAMSELYTRSIFYKFQEEVSQKDAYVVTRTSKDERICLYKVHRGESISKGRELSLDKSSNLLSCSCKMFECDGIPCRHMLAYFSRKQILKLPEHYILQRWMKSIKVNRVFDDLGRVVNEMFDASMLEKRNTLFQLSSSVIEESLLIEGGTDVVQDCLLLARKKLGLMKSSQVDGEGSSVQLSTRTPITRTSEITFKEPLPVRTKGCGKRLKGGKEKAMVKKGRRCNGCGKVGQSHDKRNCPVLLSRLAQDDTFNFDAEDDDEDEYEDEDEEIES